jgi:PAS domain S-box-containing protein
MDSFMKARGEPDRIELADHRLLEQVQGEAMFLVDTQGRISSWNEGVLQILGWDRADWIGQPLHVAFTAEDAQAGVPQGEMEEAARTGCAEDNRWMRRRNGEHFYALGTLTRLLDDTGTLVGYLKVLRDFTPTWEARVERDQLLVSQGQARSQAERQGAALAAAIDAIADGVLVSDANGVHRCNDAALRLLCASTVEALREPPQQLVQRLRLRRDRRGPLLPAAELPHTAPAGAAGGQCVMELWATRPDDGADVCMRWAVSPIVVEARVIGTVAVLSDLTEHLRLHAQGRDLRRVQSALQERDAELRALVDGVRDYAIFTLDTQGLVSSWHLGAELMKGYTADEAIGVPFAQLFTPEDQASGRPALEMATAARTGEYKGDGQRVRKDGSRFDAAVVLTALRSRDGQLLGFLKLTRDITQQRDQERQREQSLRDAEQARADAERANHSKGEFLATISHELRTPLSAILGWAHVLERGVFDAETVKHGLAAISRNARLQVQLIEDLLDMNRIESGQLRLDLQRIELGGVIAAAIDSALPAASAKGIGLRTVFSAGHGVVQGDAARLQQVVGNLLSNAIKFTPQGGQISVTLSHWQGQAQIAVADTGQGIEPGFLGRMFDRFQQQDATTTRRHGGLVQLHGGSVQAHSLGPWQGATFTVLLPSLAGAQGADAHPAPVPTALAMQQPPAMPVPVRLDGVSVLLVDDEPDVRAVTMRLLQEAGAHVVTAANAEEALASLQADRPAVMLSDIAMPGADGYELLRRVRALPADAGGQTPAAALTAYARPEDRERALAVGYQLHLAKPVAPAALVQAVASLAGR